MTWDTIEQKLDSWVNFYFHLTCFDNFFTIFIGREIFGVLSKVKYYDNETGEDTIHLVDESPIMFYATYIVPKSSPFISSYNTVIRWAIEAGLIDQIKKASLHKQELKRLERYRKGLMKDKKRQVIRLQHSTDLFLFWIICIILCCCAFLVEFTVHNIKNKIKKKHIKNEIVHQSHPLVHYKFIH